jgi:multidrug efflux pump
LTLGVTLATMLGTVGLYIIVPKGFFPQQDGGRLTGSILASQDISYQDMSKLLPKFQSIVSADPAIENCTAFLGGGNSGRLFAALKPIEKRDVTADQVVARLRAKCSGIPGADLFLQPVQDLRIGGRTGAAQYQYTILGNDPDELFQWAPKFFQRMKAIPQLADVNTDQQDKGLEATVAVDRPTAARLGITSQIIDDTLYSAFGQRFASTTYTPFNQYHVVLEVDSPFWQSPEGLNNIYCRSTTGALVPLSAFATFTRRTAPLQVNHQSQLPSVTISFNLAPNVPLGDAVAAIDRAKEEIRMPHSMSGYYMGTAQAFKDSLANQPYLILAALVAVYIVLGVLYESLIHPITIISTLPSAGVGALLALIICRTDLSVISLIGIILLIGIVKKNAILMIDFALEVERREGTTPEESIFQACLLRFRPITMTTLAALLGGLPLAMGTGTGSELRRPLGIAIVGGLIFSQMLTLFTTPVIYLYLDRFSLWWKRRRKAKGVRTVG